MSRINQILTLIIISAMVYACGDSAAESDKMQQLESYKAELKELQSKIDELESELAADGKMVEPVGNKVLINTIKLQPQTFRHQIDVRGSVQSRENIMLKAESMGKIKAIKVKEGQKVSKGQLLVQLDDEILQNSLAEVETSLELAKTVFEKQSNLWEQNIGTEIQYLQAKNNKEALERKLETIKSQLDQTKIYAPFRGIVDNIPARVGDVAQPGVPLLRMVSDGDYYIEADVSEAFLGTFDAGDEVEVYFPSLDKTVNSSISSVGQVINSDNRTFRLEVKLPAVDFVVKPNQVVILSLTDYQNDDAFVLPTKIIQTDNIGQYVYRIVSEDGQQLAKKNHIKIGKTFDLKTEIIDGVKSDMLIANDGYRDLTEGVAVKVTQ